MSELVQLGHKYGTDKGDAVHTANGENYLSIYEKYFHFFKNKPINFLEIGVNTGASIKVWEEYFPTANIFGLDIDPVCRKYATRRTYIEIGSQTDETVISKLLAKAPRFDIIIDDGSHVNKFTLKSFQLLFPHLSSRGIYIIEDLQPSYMDLRPHVSGWPGMHYNKNLNAHNKRKDMDKFFLGKIKDMDFKKTDILSMHFWSMICVIIKA